MQKITRADVYIENNLVGTLVEYERKIAFQYSSFWLNSGFSISPFSLPLKPEIFIPKDFDFNGLFGVFDDSLPDGWGRLLTDRYLQSQGIDKREINELTRLCMLSEDSAGCLKYVPHINKRTDSEVDDLDELFSMAKAILTEKDITEEELDSIYQKGGSSGGARPKVNMTFDGEMWIVKFPASFDGLNAGVQEYECNKMAVDAGVNVADFKLIKSSQTKGFFATKRFDRRDNTRIHMISLSGLLESSHRIPALDYKHLLQVSQILTQSEKEIIEAFRRACFNIFISNQDDHGKNFAFLFDGDERKWYLSPAYDLTKSTTSFGEHSTTVMGKGRNITEDDLRRLADEFEISERVRNEILSDIRKVVSQSKNRII